MSLSNMINSIKIKKWNISESDLSKIEDFIKKEIKNIKTEKIELSEEELKAVAQVSIDKIKNMTVKPSEPATIYCLDGLPGTGKSSILDKLLLENPNTVVLDWDSYSELHPNYEQIVKKGYNVFYNTKYFCFMVMHMLVLYCIENKINVLMENTFSDWNSFMDRATRFKEAGFNVNLMLIVANKDTIYYSSIKRAHATYLSGKKIQAVAFEWSIFNDKVKDVLNNLNRIKESNFTNKISLYRRFKDSGILVEKEEVDIQNIFDKAKKIYYSELNHQQIKIYIEVLETIISDHDNKKVILDDFSIKNTREFIEYLKSKQKI